MDNSTRSEMNPIRKALLEETNGERDRQESKWGEQNHPSHNPAFRPPPKGLGNMAVYGVLSADAARAQCDGRAENGSLSYADILVEEVAEALEEAEGPALREELIQVAAVCLAWVECIDRRTA